MTRARWKTKPGHPDGVFAYAPQAGGTGFHVTVASQPSNPTAPCTVSDSSGTLMGDNITSVIVNCVSAFTVGGTVSGLELPGLVLELDNGSLLLFDQDGTYTFSTNVPDGATYNVTAPVTPAAHNCTIANASGSIAQTDVDNVDVSCTTDIEFADDFETLLNTPTALD